MSDIAIRVEHLGKKFRIPHHKRHDTMRDLIMHKLSGLLGKSKANGNANNGDEEFWALKDVNFDIRHGEVVGIIGRNGAGKSTLLKTLSRITEPTEGQAIIEGRVGSLLEVGTGFHPELSGRENIYLNGAILGMKKAEISRKFDEIVAFSEIEKFIDTPVKHYSSGMYTRLAFAVAAHLEPEILIVDEVLAVGDAVFQKKCLGKMGDIAKEGRTVLFVSHNMGAISTLCSRAIFLKSGSVIEDGEAAAVVSKYIQAGREALGEKIWNDLAKAPGNEKIRIQAVRIVSAGETTADVEISRDFEVQIDFCVLREGLRACSSIHIYDSVGTCVLATANMTSVTSEPDHWYGREHPKGVYRSTCTLPANFLNEGIYSISALILTDATQVEARIEEAVSFTVHETGEMRHEYAGQWIGVVKPKLPWHTEQLEPASIGKDRS